MSKQTHLSSFSSLVVRFLMSERGKLARVVTAVLIGAVVKAGWISVEESGTYFELLTGVVAGLLLAIGEWALTRFRLRNTSRIQVALNAALPQIKDIPVDGIPGPQTATLAEELPQSLPVTSTNGLCHED